MQSEYSRMNLVTISEMRLLRSCRSSFLTGGEGGGAAAVADEELSLGGAALSLVGASLSLGGASLSLGGASLYLEVASLSSSLSLSNSEAAADALCV